MVCKATLFTQLLCLTLLPWFRTGHNFQKVKHTLELPACKSASLLTRSIRCQYWQKFVYPDFGSPAWGDWRWDFVGIFRPILDIILFDNGHFTFLMYFGESFFGVKFSVFEMSSYLAHLL